MEETASLL